MAAWMPINQAEKWHIKGEAWKPDNQKSQWLKLDFTVQYVRSYDYR